MRDCENLYKGCHHLASIFAKASHLYRHYLNLELQDHMLHYRPDHGYQIIIFIHCFRNIKRASLVYSHLRTIKMPFSFVQMAVASDTASARGAETHAMLCQQVTWTRRFLLDSSEIPYPASASEWRQYITCGPLVIVFGYKIGDHIDTLGLYKETGWSAWIWA